MAESRGFNLADVLKAVPKMDTGEERLERIDIDLLQDDARNFYELSDLDGLAENIELVGLQQPVRVRPDPAVPGKYIIVSGHRRRAAIRMLVDDGREDLQRIPCIVEPGQESEAMQELRLIFANSGTRKLSDAELAIQADRVTALLYKLKEEGVEFKGRIRDHVAEACQISKSKLARLNVIQKGLEEPLLSRWQAGKLDEASAYALARMPMDLQWRLGSFQKLSTATRLEQLRVRAEAGATWTTDLWCEDGPCSHADGFLRHAMEDPWDTQCNGSVCCLKCPRGASRDWDACPRMCSKAKTARKERKAKDEERQERTKHRKITAAQKKTIDYARRIIRAADAAGLADNVTISWRYPAQDLSIGQIRKWAQEDFSEGWCSYMEDPELDPNALKTPWSTVKTLQCSADYLLGLTDELHPTVLPEPSGYREGPGPEGKRQDAVGIFDFGDGLDLYRCFVTWDGKEWAFMSNITFEGKLVGWYPIPETPKAPEGKTPKRGVDPDIVNASPCVTGLSPSGYCGAAAHCGEPYDCCNLCDADCSLRCGWSLQNEKEDGGHGET